MGKTPEVPNRVFYKKRYVVAIFPPKFSTKMFLMQMLMLHIICFSQMVTFLIMHADGYSLGALVAEKWGAIKDIFSPDDCCGVSECAVVVRKSCRCRREQRHAD